MSSWQQYFEKHKGRAPHSLYVKGVTFAESLHSAPPRHAIDLGSGPGIESTDLLRRGWNVLALDAEMAAMEALQALVGSDDRLESRITSFEEISRLPLANFIYAYQSLPFCRHERLDHLWELIRGALQKNGVFTGTFFGPNDDWVKGGKCAGTSAEKLAEYFVGFEIVHQREVDEAGPTALSGAKHWHYTEVIAKKI